MGTEKERSPIQGRLGSVSLNDLIQLLAMTRRTATLALKRGRTRGYVFFRDGQIVHAEAGRVEGEDATRVVAELEIRHTSSTTLPDGQQQVRAGCRFVSPSPELLALVDAYLAKHPQP